MKLEDQQEIAKLLKLSAKDLVSFMYFLDVLRNTCAHGGRIYMSDRPFTKRKFIPDTMYRSSLHLETNESDNFIEGKNDVLAMLIAFKLLSQNGDFSVLKNRFIKAYKPLLSKIPPHVLIAVDKSMGMPYSRLLGL